MPFNNNNGNNGFRGAEVVLQAMLAWIKPHEQCVREGKLVAFVPASRTDCA